LQSNAAVPTVFWTRWGILTYAASTTTTATTIIYALVLPAIIALP
jgi:hypothetical protein